jgi:hypothetical protein
MGLAVALGDRTKTDSFSSPSARQLLPADAVARVDTNPGQPLGLTSPDAGHPIFSQYAEELRTELGTVPVFRYEKVARAESGTRELLKTTDGASALVERVFDKTVPGRVLLWSIPLARRPSSTDPAAWSDFPRSWSFVQVTNRMAAYLADSAEDTSVIEAGRDISLGFDPIRGFNAALVKGPGDRPGERRVIEAADTRLIVSNADALGHWGVGFTGPNNVAQASGFSVNPPAAESLIRTLTPEQLDQTFGKGGYALAQDTATLEKAVGLARVGVEFFPWLMLLLLLILTLENYLANRFYREEPAVVPAMTTQGGRA